MKSHLSASGIKRYRKCPKQWWYRYESDQEPKEGDTRFLDLGSAVHDTIEAALKGADARDKYWYYAEYHAVVEEMWQDGLEYVNRALDYADRRDEEILDVEAEETFRIDRPDVDAEVRAKIDVATENEIWDWKTGSIRDDTETDEKIQGSVYMAAYRTLYGRPPKKIRFVYLKEEEVRTLEPSDRIWKQMLAHARKLTSAKQKGEFPADPGDVCHWCDYQQFCPEGGGIGATFDWSKWRAL